MDCEIILSAKDVEKLFTDHGHAFYANQDVTFDLYRGEILGIVGESGSGKSTLAKMIMNISQPTAGEILIGGQNMANLKGEPLRQARQNIQMIFQNPIGSMNPKKRVVEIVCEPLRNYGRLAKCDMEKKATELLEMVELNETFLNKFPHQMSGGQAQRVAIARALALEPDILLCDEATSALDASVQRSIVDTLIRLNREKGISMILIAHDIFMTKYATNRMVIMEKGRIVEILDSQDFGKAIHAPYTQRLVQSARALVLTKPH